MLKQSRFLLAFFLACLVSVASKAAAQSSSAGSNDENSAVRKILSGLSAADRAGDLAAVLSHYAEDAVLLPPNSAPLAGRTGVRSFYETGFQRFRFEVSFDADEIHLAGEWAFAQGFINGQFIPKGEGAARKLHEKYLMVLHRENLAWKIYRLIWNASGPPAPAAK